MNIRLLYPNDPTDPKAVDEFYRDEYETARAAGFQTSIFSLEDFEAGVLRPRPAFVPGDILLYRGWMLTVAQYEYLVHTIESDGAEAYISTEQYRLCHHLPQWYPFLHDMTPETIILPQDADFEKALVGKNWPGYFVKDYVKSLNTDIGSLVDTPRKIAHVVELMRQFKGSIEGGICVRKREDFEPGSERRAFVLNGRPFSADDVISPLVIACTARIPSPFFSVDTAIRSDGTERIVEIGDGQVSDRKEWGPERFIDMLSAIG